MPDNYTSSHGVGAAIDDALAKAALLTDISLDDAGKILQVKADRSGFELVAVVRDIPSGTSMVFNQAAAPVGWTKKSDWADNATILVGNSYGSGGSDSPASWATAISINDHVDHSHTIGNEALSEAEMTSHYHSYRVASGSQSHSSGGYARRDNGPHNGTINTQSKGGGGNHNHGGNTGAVSHPGAKTHTVNQDTYTPIYQIMIAATRN